MSYIPDWKAGFLAPEDVLKDGEVPLLVLAEIRTDSNPTNILLSVVGDERYAIELNTVLEHLGIKRSTPELQKVFSMPADSTHGWCHVGRLPTQIIFGEKGDSRPLQVLTNLLGREVEYVWVDGDNERLAEPITLSPEEK